MLRKLCLAVLMLCLPMAAAAKPPELATAIASPEPVGRASMKALWIEVYHASFWSDSGGWHQPPYALSLTYGMAFTARELADRSAEEMAHVSQLPADTRERYATQLATLWHDVQEGDRMTALAQDGGTVFFHNGRRLGAIQGDDFRRAFFGIWLSPESSEPDMQRQLLAGSPQL